MLLPEPWVLAGARAAYLQRELALELGPGHSLMGRDMRAVAVRKDCDDALFISVGEPLVVAVVHLTYAGRPEVDPRWPHTTLFDSIEDWIERGMGDGQ